CADHVREEAQPARFRRGDYGRPRADRRSRRKAPRRLLNVSAVQTLVAILLCPKCNGKLLSLREEGIAINLQFVVSCSTCGDIVATPHSPSISKFRENELAVRLGVVGKDCGISFTKLTNLFGGLNALTPHAHVVEGATNDSGGFQISGIVRKRKKNKLKLQTHFSRFRFLAGILVLGKLSFDILNTEGNHSRFSGTEIFWGTR
ncbi:unnamed protein product, partial [Ixodes pacificus]